MLFVHEGSGVFESNFGPMRYGPGDYIVIPIGTTWRLDQDAGSDHRILYVESPSEIVPPKRYRNEWGQLLEHSPYSDRDIRIPEEAPAHDESGDFVVWVRARGRLTAYHFKHHPLDVVGWDGYLYPFIFNIGDFEPITGPHPSATAGPPDVRRTQLRGVLVRAAQVRLPPARDPRSVQPFEHQLATRSSTTSRAIS